MKVITYWETAPGRTIPPYVALGIASMRLALGESFLLLTPRNTPEYIGEEYLSKRWTFPRTHSNVSPTVAEIVAKSDYIRIAYVHRHGGFWLDADSIVLKNFLPSLRPTGKELLWHCMAFFGAAPGNEILEAAAAKCLNSDRLIWGNVGGIDGMIAERPDAVRTIPFEYVNPGHSPIYSWHTCAVLMDRDLPVEAFLRNPDVKLMKLYNTDLSGRDIAAMSLDEFFDSGTLISRIFLKVCPDIAVWCREAEAVTLMTSL